jgi:hypothetical protein
MDHRQVSLAAVQAAQSIEPPVAAPLAVAAPCDAQPRHLSRRTLVAPSVVAPPVAALSVATASVDILGAQGGDAAHRDDEGREDGEIEQEDGHCLCPIQACWHGTSNAVFGSYAAFRAHYVVSHIIGRRGYPPYHAVSCRADGSSPQMSIAGSVAGGD